MDQGMTRFLIALAAIATTTVPLLALNGSVSPRKTSQIVIVGSDHPILLMRMVVIATALPDS